MPALIPTSYYGTITWLGHVADRDAALESAPARTLIADFAGPRGEAHGGLTRPACSRVKALYPRDTTIRNVRQFSILGQDDLAAIAADMGLPALDPALVGATMVIAGIPDFSHVPPSSRLQAEGGATLVVDMENRPCTLPARPIEARHPGFGKTFKPAAAGRRGVTAWVEREGTFTLGEKVRLHVPDQPVWAHLDVVRATGS
jgi:hypothetical protein